MPSSAEASACSPLLRISSSVLATFTIFYGIFMEEYTCEARLPHINVHGVRNKKYRGTKAWYINVEITRHDHRSTA